MERERIKYLIGKVISHTASAEELDELRLIVEGNENEQLLQEMEISFGGTTTNQIEFNTDADRWLEKANQILAVDKRLEYKGSKHGKKVLFDISFLKYAAAVAAVLIISVFIFKQSARNFLGNKVVSVEQVKITEDIPSGRNRAVLKLANGSSIILDSMQNGRIASQGSTSIVKQEDGQIAYQLSSKDASPDMINEMSTPNGGQYRLVLPDGTKVWMNAASSIKYPVRFDGKNRKVEVQGELYFEVFKNPQQPFIVHAGNAIEIRVLGTHFNVNTYKDEKYMRTTLLEGSIHISSATSEKMLIPGEQAQMDAAGKLFVKENVDLNAVVAWKNGLFNFNKLTTHEIMNQLARWYDIEIKYEGIVSDQIYGGEIQRDLNLSQVLKMLQKSGMHCRLDQKVLTVIP